MAASSRAHDGLVFAERRAAALGLPFRPVVVKTRETKPQMELENSHQQLRNVWGAFTVEGDLPAGEAVLLVDDLVDSRRTSRWLRGAPRGR